MLIICTCNCALMIIIQSMASFLLVWVTDPYKPSASSSHTVSLDVHKLHLQYNTSNSCSCVHITHNNIFLPFVQFTRGHRRLAIHSELIIFILTKLQSINKLRDNDSILDVKECFVVFLKYTIKTDNTVLTRKKEEK